jgi:tetrahydromethanopterin S-methyltransferase subunit G
MLPVCFSVFLRSTDRRLQDELFKRVAFPVGAGYAVFFAVRVGRRLGRDVTVLMSADEGTMTVSAPPANRLFSYVTP